MNKHFGMKFYGGFLAMNFLLPSTTSILLSNHSEPRNQKSLIIKALSDQHFIQEIHNNVQQGICNWNHSSKTSENSASFHYMESPWKAQRSRKEMKEKWKTKKSVTACTKKRKRVLHPHKLLENVEAYKLLNLFLSIGIIVTGTSL